MTAGNKVHSVLLIDDDADDYELVAEAMENVDPSVRVFHTDGCEVKYPTGDFDMILLDINLPQNDGFYWLNYIRNENRNKVPVVMYSNSTFKDHIERAYKGGANIYFAKPESFGKLMDGLRTILQMDWSAPDEVSKSFINNGYQAI